jgi:hypothetical protein
MDSYVIYVHHLFNLIWAQHMANMLKISVTWTQKMAKMDISMFETPESPNLAVVRAYLTNNYEQRLKMNPL